MNDLFTFRTVKELVENGVLDRPLDGNHGGTHPKGDDFVESGIPFIMASDIVESKIDLIGCKFIRKDQADKLRKGFASQGDVLLTHKATIGRTAIVPKIPWEYIMLTPQVTYYRILKPNILNNKYLKYYFDSSHFQNTLASLAGSGSTRAYIGITDQLRLKINYPPLPEQKAIASILSAIDEKIELNLQMNKTLEEMAMTLYKHWFVDFGPFKDGKFVESELGMIPKGWQVKTIADVADVNANSIMKNEAPASIGYIDISSVKEGWVENINHIKYKNAPSRAKRKIKDGDIVWSSVRPNRKSRFLSLGFNRDTIVSTGFTVISPTKVPYSYLYTYSCTNNFVDYLVSRATGSSYPAVTGKIFAETKILIPDSIHLVDFDNIIQPYYVKISTNNIQNRSLKNYRDTILPKLISGQVRLKEFEKQVTEAL